MSKDRHELDVWEAWGAIVLKLQDNPPGTVAQVDSSSAPIDNKEVDQPKKTSKRRGRPGADQAE